MRYCFKCFVSFRPNSGGRKWRIFHSASLDAIFTSLNVISESAKIDHIQIERKVQ